MTFEAPNPKHAHFMPQLMCDSILQYIRSVSAIMAVIMDMPDEKFNNNSKSFNIFLCISLGMQYFWAFYLSY